MAKLQNTNREQAKFCYKSPYSPIGLDLGSAKIKLIQLNRTYGLPALYRHAVIPTPADIYANGEILDSAKLGKILFRFASKLKLHGRKVNLCLGPQSYFMSIIELPSMTRRELVKTLPFEVEKQFPLKADAAVYDCCPLSLQSAKDNRLNKYILAATARKTADSLTEAAVQAGFKPQALEISPLALLRLRQIRQNSLAIKSTAPELLLDIGYRSTTFLMTKDSELQYYRQLRISIADFINSIAAAKGLNSQQAPNFLYQPGNLTDNSLQNLTGQLAAQINQSIAYWLDHSSGQTFNPVNICLSGGGASIPGLAPYLQDKLGLKVTYQMLSHDSETNRTGRAQAVIPCPHLYATACGLALRGWIR